MPVAIILKVRTIDFKLTVIIWIFVCDTDLQFKLLMKDSQNEIMQIFGGKVRIRICGICFKDNQILLVKHAPLGEKGYLWAPPGGGIEFGESYENCLVREIKEETGLTVKVKGFLFANEYISPPLHALEFFFETELIGGQLKQGKDPELEDGTQIINQVDFIELSEIKAMDRLNLHALFSYAESKNEILNLTGFLKGYPK